MVEVRRALPFLLLPLLLLAAGCSLLPFRSPSPTAVPGGVPAATIRQHQQLWRAQGIDTYTLRLTYGCECGISGPVTIHVVDGAATEATNANGIVAATPDVPMTIDALFDHALQVIDGGGRVDVEWSATNGAPSRITFDPIPNAIDDELSVTVDGLTPGP